MFWSPVGAQLFKHRACRRFEFCLLRQAAVRLFLGVADRCMV